jgi:Fic family protein
MYKQTIGFCMSPYKMEPLMPEEGNKDLEDLAIDITIKATNLNQQLKPQVIEAIGNLVCSMNCYYSNLIEDHYTHPIDIEKALKEDYSTIPEKRELQLEAKAHIEVQKLIELNIKESDFLSPEYIKWIHREFYTRLPLEIRQVENPKSGETKEIIPGEFRKTHVQIGRHIPPDAEQIESFLKRFQTVYNPVNHSKVRQIIAIPASHQRFSWIHPFYDGNGRVVRLLSNAYFLKIGLGSSMWSVSRGLARTVNEYKSLLALADQPRKNDFDGRGNLSASALLDFCQYFLITCIDQIDFMSSLLKPESLLDRIEKYTYEEIEKKNLHPGSFNLLREVYYTGEIERGKVSQITGYAERQARKVLTKLLDNQLLASDTPRGPVRLNFPVRILDRWFPNLFSEK